MTTERQNVSELSDPRDQLVRTKYFSMRPRPLERWLWAQSLSQAAERVFWFHWDAGARAGDWCSQVPIRVVAQSCCVDPATVTRAYQQLKKLQLIRRENPGRDPHNPFCQATAITEVRLPSALLATLHRAPTRAISPRRTPPTQGHAAQRVPPLPAVDSAAPPSRATDAVRPTGLKEAKALYAKLSEGEQSRYQNAQRLQAKHFEFDADTRLTPPEQAYFLNSLTPVHAQSAVQPRTSVRAETSAQLRAPRGLTPLELARIRRRVLELMPGEAGAEFARQVAWSVEAGALARFGAVHGLNIALKKIREGAWTKPLRMPPNWLRTCARRESCSVA